MVRAQPPYLVARAAKGSLGRSMLRPPLAAGALLFALGCAHTEPAATVERHHGEDELSGLRRENLALRRRVQMLEDRVLRLEHQTEPIAATPLPPRVATTLRPQASAPPTTTHHARAPSISLGHAPQSAEAEAESEALDWDERLDPYGSEDAQSNEAGESVGGYRLVGSQLVKLTQDRGPVPADPPARGRKARTIEARYQSAMSLYKAGDLHAAEQAFAELARQEPQSDWADNALYWKGEAAYDQGHYADALASFTAVVERYGGGNKAPDALLKIGLCYDKLGDAANAHDVLRRLVAAYPGARASDIARARLAELEVQT